MTTQLHKQLDLPLGKITGLFSLSLTVLVGVFSGHEPYVIAMRAVAAAFVCGFAGYFIGRIVVVFLRSN